MTARSHRALPAAPGILLLSERISQALQHADALINVMTVSVLPSQADISGTSEVARHQNRLQTSS